jgi:hypothetical protein
MGLEFKIDITNHSAKKQREVYEGLYLSMTSITVEDVWDSEGHITIELNHAIDDDILKKHKNNELEDDRVGILLTKYEAQILGKYLLSISKKDDTANEEN